MPNPFVGNDEAARYIADLGSKEAMRASVQRLYQEGMQRRREAVRRVEEEVYPPLMPPLRTAKEIELHSYAMALEEQQKRRQRFAELERNVYGAMLKKSPSPVRDKDIAKRCYDDQVRRLARRDACIKALKQKCGAPLSPTPAEKEEKAKLAQRERKFNPAARKHADPLAEVAKLLLVCDVPQPPPKPSTMPKDDLAEHWNRLAKPRADHVTPRHKMEKHEKAPFTTVFKNRTASAH